MENWLYILDCHYPFVLTAVSVISAWRCDQRLLLSIDLVLTFTSDCLSSTTWKLAGYPKIRHSGHMSEKMFLHVRMWCVTMWYFRMWCFGMRCVGMWCFGMRRVGMWYIKMWYFRMWCVRMWYFKCGILDCGVLKCGIKKWGMLKCGIFECGIFLCGSLKCSVYYVMFWNVVF